MIDPATGTIAALLVSNTVLAFAALHCRNKQVDAENKVNGLKFDKEYLQRKVRRLRGLTASLTEQNRGLRSVAMTDKPAAKQTQSREKSSVSRSEGAKFSEPDSNLFVSDNHSAVAPTSSYSGYSGSSSSCDSSSSSSSSSSCD